MKSWLIRTVSVIFCVLLGVISLSLRTIGFAPSDFIGVSPSQHPASWQISHADTLVSLSEDALEAGDIERAKLLALDALKKNITSGRATAHLMLIYEQQGLIEQANTLAQFSETLWPAHTYTRSRLADYWLRRDDLQKTLAEWSILMDHSPGLRQRLYPILQDIANDPERFVTLQPYISNPPKWWTSFFNYTSNENKQLDTVRGIYQLRVDSTTPIDEQERRGYINRLLKENLWDEAYLSWLSGLEPDQLTWSGLIYDGGFESTSSNTGFDWILSNTNGVKTDTTTTNGMVGKKALRIVLDDKNRINFQHVSQRLMLTPEAYTLSLRYRIDRLKTGEGLRWRIHCINNNSIRLLAESQLLADRSPWSDLQFSFEIPTIDCPAQLLRLEASSPYEHNHSFKGSLWFDDIKIAPSAPNAETEQK